jgi:hypothetical protein
MLYHAPLRNLKLAGQAMSILTIEQKRAEEPKWFIATPPCSRRFPSLEEERLRWRVRFCLGAISYSNSALEAASIGRA